MRPNPPISNRLLHTVEIQVVRLDHARDLPLPTYATPGSAGMDLLAAVDEPMTLSPGRRILVPTGIQIALTDGFEAQVRARSGLAIRHGIGLVNAPGTIDSDYRGEIKVILINWGAEDHVIRRGDRIAQLVIVPIVRAIIKESAELPETDRGEGGFGHTG